MECVCACVCVCVCDRKIEKRRAGGREREKEEKTEKEREGGRERREDRESEGGEGENEATSCPFERVQEVVSNALLDIILLYNSQHQ